MKSMNRRNCYCLKKADYRRRNQGRSRGKCSGMIGMDLNLLKFRISTKVIVIESRDRIGGRFCTDYSFGFHVHLGASWLHGVSKYCILHIDKLYINDKFQSSNPSIPLDPTKNFPMELINEVPPIKVEGRIAVCEGDTNPALVIPYSSYALTRVNQLSASTVVYAMSKIIIKSNRYTVARWMVWTGWVIFSMDRKLETVLVRLTHNFLFIFLACI